MYDCDYNIAGEASNSFYASLEVNNLRLNGELYCNKYKTVSCSDFIGNDNYDEGVYPYKFKINVKGISGNGITTDINGFCNIEYYYYENNEKHSSQVNAGSYATINLKNKTQNLNVFYKITCSDANYVSDKDVRSIIIPVYDTVENTIVL